jgi:L-aminoadipate-semialdehyde dehydrogenase
VTGNLGDPELGLSKDVWEELSQSVDIVIHNGALVHWVYARDFC